jgi:hypothetical protein
LAVGLVAELIGDSLIRALERSQSRFARKADVLVDWLREVAEPPAGLELRATDGSRYSGVFVAQANRVVVMLAVRHPTTAGAPMTTTASAGYPARRYGQYFDPDPAEIDPNDPRWDRDVNPFRR